MPRDVRFNITPCEMHFIREVDCMPHDSSSQGGSLSFRGFEILMFEFSLQGASYRGLSSLSSPIPLLLSCFFLSSSLTRNIFLISSSNHNASLQRNRDCYLAFQGEGTQLNDVLAALFHPKFYLPTRLPGK